MTIFRDTGSRQSTALNALTLLPVALGANVSHPRDSGSPPALTE